ncbi:MAG: hypothetical protein ABIE23_03830 [archaeon]
MPRKKKSTIIQADIFGKHKVFQVPHAKPKRGEKTFWPITAERLCKAGVITKTATVSKGMRGDVSVYVGKRLKNLFNLGLNTDALIDFLVKENLRDRGYWNPEIKTSQLARGLKTKIMREKRTLTPEEQKKVRENLRVIINWRNRKRRGERTGGEARVFRLQEKHLATIGRSVQSKEQQLLLLLRERGRVIKNDSLMRRLTKLFERIKDGGKVELSAEEKAAIEVLKGRIKESKRFPVPDDRNMHRTERERYRTILSELEKKRK